MSAETFPISTSNESDHAVPTTEELRIIVNGPEAEETIYEAQESVTDSTAIEVTATSSQEFNIPVESRKARVWRRVANFLHDRIANPVLDGIESAHAKADQADAYASYEENIQHTKDHESALKMNERYDRNEKVKAVLSKVGYVALGYVAKGADTATRGLDTAYFAAKDTATAAAGIATEKYDQAKDSTLRGLDTAYFAAKDTALAAKGVSLEAFDTAKDKAVSLKDKLIEKYRAAQTRKAARIEKIHTAVDKKKDQALELWQSAQGTRRALGAKALATYRSTQGNVASSIAGAHAAGVAAKEAWSETRHSL